MPDGLTVADLWRAIEARIEVIGQGYVERLAPGLSTDEIGAFQAALGVELPGDYVASLREHAGMQLNESRSGRPYPEMLIADFIPLPPTVVLERRAWLRDGYDGPAREHARIDGAIRHRRYDEGWIPVLARDGDASVFECIDTVPAEGGTYGQIVSMCTNDPDRYVSAPSFRGLLAGLLARFEEAVVDAELLEDEGIIRLE